MEGEMFIKFRVSEEESAWLSSEAERVGLTVSGYLRKAVGLGEARQGRPSVSSSPKPKKVSMEPRYDPPIEINRGVEYVPVVGGVPAVFENTEERLRMAKEVLGGIVHPPQQPKVEEETPFQDVDIVPDEFTQRHY